MIHESTGYWGNNMEWGSFRKKAYSPFYDVKYSKWIRFDGTQATRG